MKASKQIRPERIGAQLPGGESSVERVYHHPPDMYSGFLFLQRTLGNHAVANFLQSEIGSTTGRVPTGELKKKHDAGSSAQLLQRASAETGTSLDNGLRFAMESHFDKDLENVRVHSGAASALAADAIGARAYTVGSDIHLGSAAGGLKEADKSRLLAHEVTHAIQQGGRPSPLQGAMRVSHPSDQAEKQATRVAEDVLARPRAAPSRAIALRNAMRTIPVAPSIQRDIIGTKALANGEMKIHFTKHEGAVPGDKANEDGKITFTPNAKAPESNSIRLLQIVRTTDKSSGTETDFTWAGGEAARMKIMTAADAKKAVAPGFYLDQIHASQKQRTKKADPTVLPYYTETSPGTTGQRKGKTIVPATLEDTPGGPPPGRFVFATSAKASDTGVWYGTVLWGFELYLDAKGVQKIKGEYRSFREEHGATTDEALRQFNEHYKNPGASTAPTK